MVSGLGIAWIIEGWVAGDEGFNSTHSVLIVASWLFSLAWMIWLVVLTRRAPRVGESAVQPAH